jgi:predicted phage tail protein
MSENESKETAKKVVGEMVVKGATSAAFGVTAITAAVVFGPVVAGFGLIGGGLAIMLSGKKSNSK